MSTSTPEAPGAAREKEIAAAARRSPRSAVARARRLLRRRDLGAEERARLMRAEGSALHAGGRHGDAAAAYARAAAAFRRAGLPVEAARTGIGRIDALAQCGRAAAAVAEADRILPVLRKAGRAEAAAMASANAAGVLLRADRPAEARPRFLAARRIFERRGNGFAVALCDFNLANAAAATGDGDESRARYAAARAAFAAAGHAALAAQADYNEGCLAAFEDRASAALDLFARADAAFASLSDPRHRALVALDRGEVHLRRGLLAEAVEDLERAAAGFRRLGLRPDGARAASLLGLARGLRGDVTGAAREFAAARRGFRSAGSDAGLATVDLHAAAAGVLRGVAAERALVRAEETFARRRLRLPRVQALVLRARLRGDVGAARRALRLLRTLPSPAASFAALRVLAEAARAAGRRRAALRLHGEALEALERLRDGLTADALRVALLAEAEGFVEDAARLLLEGRGGGGPARALEVLERARGRALLDMALLGEGAAEGPEEGEEEARLRAALRLAYNRLAGLGGVRGGGTAVEVRRLEDRLARLRRAEGPRGGSVPPESAEALLRRIPAGAVVVEYLLGPDDGRALVATAAGVDVVEGLPGRAVAADLAGALRYEMDRAALGGEFAARHRARLAVDCAALLDEVSARFLDPVAHRTGGARTYFVLHGPLHGLPLGALVEGGAAVLPGLRFLGRDGSSRTGGRPLLVAPPGTGVDGVAEEARAVARWMEGATVLEGMAATRAAFLAAAPGASDLHLATHGLFRADNPLASAFALADGWISAREMLRYRLRASLVVLSACESGVAAMVPGAEILGLPRGFLGAGARSVVAALWRVPGAETARFMDDFRRAIHGGDDVVAALAAARGAARGRGEHPVSWAAFTVFGEGQGR